MKKYILLLMAVATNYCLGQVQTYYIKPIQTDPNYLSSEDSSAISRNAGFQVNKLFLFIGGTGSSSSTDYNALRLHAANLGYEFINLSYPNNVAAASLANSSDSMTFNYYRQEVCFGTPLSADVTIDTLNSIYTRTLKLIQYLDLTHPTENWGQYLSSPTTLDWTKIVVGGHSQGSGHACYLGKFFPVDRVLMFSGPNDYSNTFSNSANWLRQAGVTPVIKHFSYLSLNDEVVDFSKQFVNISGLSMLVSDDTTYIDNIPSPYGNSHCLYTAQAPGIVILNHNVPIKLSTINNGVWTYMLTSTITTGINNDTELSDLNVYPNPANNFIYLNSGSLPIKTTYIISNLLGQIIKTGLVNQQEKSYPIEVSDLKTGIYILNVNGLKVKFVKE